jgi:hypothetical protein
VRSVSDSKRQAHADLEHAGRLAPIRGDTRDRRLQLLKIAADPVQETFARFGQGQLARAAMKQPNSKVALEPATLRLMAARLSDSRLAAAEKPPVSALETKDSRFARVSMAKTFK